MDRIYLDNAATSWPKPEIVYTAIDRFQRENGAAAGRGAYQSGQQAQRVVSATRSACARLLGIADPSRVVFTANGTASLNLAIHGILNPADHVVTTVIEHNSVLRPLEYQHRHSDIELTHLPCDGSGYVDPDEVAVAIRSNTRLVVISHASNVTGALQPIKRITRIAHEHDALVLVDAAQTAGCVPINLDDLEVDLLAAGGHKGLLGPLGTGLLYVRPGLEPKLRELIQGGTGVNSAAAKQPDQLPEKLESGNLNVPALAGLGAALEFLSEHSTANIQRHHQQLTEQLISGLSQLPNVKIYGPNSTEPRVGVVSCSVEGYDPQEFAAALDASCQIECRAGLHCAPRIHGALGTDQSGGLVRFSPGWATTSEEIETTLQAISALSS